MRGGLSGIFVAHTVRDLSAFVVSHYWQGGSGGSGPREILSAAGLIPRGCFSRRGYCHFLPPSFDRRVPDFPRQYLERVVRGMMKDYAVGLGVNNVARLAAVFEDMTPALIRARAAALRAGAQGKKTSECFERIMDVLREEKMEVRVVKGQGGRGREGRKGSEERECLFFTLTPSVLFTLRTFPGEDTGSGRTSRRNHGGTVAF